MKVLKKHGLWFSLFALITVFAFHPILTNFSTSLADRFDYPYIGWVLYQNMHNLLNGSFTSYFQTSAFYPHPYGLLFSDLLLPQALLAMPVYVLTGNIIASFNFVFLLTFFLNFIAWYILWYVISKNIKAAWLGGILSVFGPFFHTQIGHFQMQSYWPAVFAFTILFYFRNRQLLPRIPNTVLAGLLMAIQFLASVYLFVFAMSAIVLKFLVHMLSKAERAEYARELLTVCVVAGVFVLPFVKGYYDMKEYYSLERHAEEYILYSAHPTDYLFTNGYRSFFYSMPIFNQWNAFNKHVIGERALFPGFTLLLLSFLGIYAHRKHSQGTLIGIELSKETLSYMLIGLMGLLFSFGPRLSFNGTYAHIPNVYLLAQKVNPLLESIRSPGRWNFLFYFGLIYFAVLALQKKNIVSKKILFWIVTLFVLIEFVPIAMRADDVHIQTTEYQSLASLCDSEDALLLEYPVTHFNAYGGIAEGLSYISQVLLSQTFHECNLVNGYSGFIPEDLFETERSMNSIVESGNVDKLYEYMKLHEIDVIKLNETYVLPEFKEGFSQLDKQLMSEPRFDLLQDSIYQIQ